MRKTIFVFSIFFSSLNFAQNPESSTLYDKEYYDLINYVPKNLEFDSIQKPESKILHVELNTISSLHVYNGLREEFELNDYDRKWLEKKIDQIAIALFLDGKRILTSAVGGYSGCPDKMISTFSLNNIEITNLKFCHTCTDSYRDENFIRIFNNRMYALMKIERPKNELN